MEKERKSLIDLVRTQQIMIAKCVEKIERWEEREKEKENITETELEKMEEENKDEDNGTYVEPMDYGASQKSVDSFATRLGLNLKDRKEGTMIIMGKSSEKM